MTVSTDDLKRLMTDLADEATVPTLHGSAIRASRRARLRSMALASVTALALVGGGVAVAATLPGDRPAPTGGPTTEPPPGPITELDGTFYIEESTPAGTSRLWKWNGVDAPETVVDIGEPGTDGIPVSTPGYGTIAVSPDGSGAAWITSDGHPWIRDLDEGTKDDVGFADAISDPECHGPAWTVDSTRVHFQTSGEWAFLYDVETDETVPVAPMPGCDVRLAQNEDGELVRFSLVTGDYRTPVVWRAIGDDAPEPLDVTLPANTGVHRLESASPDGLFLCMALGPTPGCSRYYDVEADEFIDLRLDSASVYGTSSTFDLPGMVLQHVQSPPEEGLTSGFALRTWTGEILDVVPIDAIGDVVLRYVPND